MKVNANDIVTLKILTLNKVYENGFNAINERTLKLVESERLLLKF